MVRNELAKLGTLLRLRQQLGAFCSRRSSKTSSQVPSGTQLAALVATAVSALLLPQAQHARAASKFCN